MTHKIIPTEYGVGVAFTSPCCSAPMYLKMGEAVVNKSERKIETPMDFTCEKCNSLYGITVDIQPLIRNISFTIEVER